MPAPDLRWPPDNEPGSESNGVTRAADQCNLAHSSLFPKWSETGANLFGKDLWLFPGRKVAACAGTAVIDEFMKRELRPTARR